MVSKKPETIQKSIGRVDYDADPTALISNQCIISVPPSSTLQRGDFVKIGEEPTYYLAQIVDGPFFKETRGSGLPKATFTADLSFYIDNGLPRAVLSRPLPGTPVDPIDISKVQHFLGISGNMYLGSIATNKNIGVMLDAPILSRHVGIFGTTGSGKSNSVQVMMEEASKQGFAVLVFDVEGEYVEMDKPTDMLVDLLKNFNLKPQGMRDVTVYVPNPATSNREDAIKFGIKYRELDNDVFAEASELTRMEQLYFEDLVEKVLIVTPNPDKLALKDVIERLVIRLKAQADHPQMPPFIAEAHTTLYGKLKLAHNLNLIDVKAPPIKMENVFKSGRISIVDFSDATDYVRNIVIADLLNKTFRYKIANPQSPKLLIVLEEAHAFISREKRDRMLATLMLIIETARRGRKKGLCLSIVTQQPNHLPSEILELCNTRIMHRMSSTANIDVLRLSTGNVPDGMWATIPSLGRGESVISTPKFAIALPIIVRPVKSKRIATE